MTDDKYKGMTQHDLLITVATKQDMMYNSMRSLNDKVKLQNARIKKLELWRNYVIGACGAVLVILKIVGVY